MSRRDEDKCFNDDSPNPCLVMPLCTRGSVQVRQTKPCHGLNGCQRLTRDQNK